MTMIVEITERGGLPLPPEAAAALNGAAQVTAEMEPGGGVLLKPAEAGAACAGNVSAAGELSLPPAALEIMRNWSKWNGVDGWDGRNVEVMIAEAGRSLILFYPPGPGSLALRNRIAELGLTENDVNRLVDGAKQQRYERRKAEDEAARMEPQARAGA